MIFIGIIFILLGFYYISIANYVLSTLFFTIGGMCIICKAYITLKNNIFKTDLSKSDLKIKELTKEVRSLNFEVSHLSSNNKILSEKLKYYTDVKPADDYEKAREKVLNNYKKKELEKQALLDLISEGVIFNEDDPDLKYLKSLKRKYKLDSDI